MLRDMEKTEEVLNEFLHSLAMSSKLVSKRALDRQSDPLVVSVTHSVHVRESPPQVGDDKPHSLWITLAIAETLTDMSVITRECYLNRTREGGWEIERDIEIESSEGGTLTGELSLIQCGSSTELSSRLPSAIAELLDAEQADLSS
jgi:hypothetical protein